MLPKIFYRGRFKRLCAVYGSRIELWPDHEQANARAYMRDCPQKAAADLKSALRVDEIINQLAPPLVSEESRWRAFGQLLPNIGPRTDNGSVALLETASDNNAQAPVHPVAETIEIYREDEKAALLTGKSKDKPLPSTASQAASQADAAYQIREERVRMVSKGKKRPGKGFLKFQ